MAVVFSLTIMFSSSVFAYDSEAKDIDVSGIDLGYSYVKINTFGSALALALAFNSEEDYSGTYYKKRKTSFILEGVGFVVKDGYIVTAAHVVHPDMVYAIGSRVSFYYSPPIKVLERIIMISPDVRLSGSKGGIPAEIFYLDIENDIAILKYDKDSYDLLTPIPFKLGSTRNRENGKVYDTIGVGSAISTIVRKRDKEGDLSWKFEVRTGKITSIRIYDHERIPKKAIVEYNKQDFVTDVLVFGGDSGSPAIVYRGGKPIVIGVFRSILVNKRSPIKNPSGTPISTVVRIDYVKSILEAK